ncbi:DUF547 domain-containing protein [Crocinitomix catalasitica]|nr:DUF547 domain-containing protein [Crocinitomix catalasitica]
MKKTAANSPSIIKSLFLLVFVSGSFSLLAQSDDFFDKTESFLAAYVENGLVNYDSISKSPTSLDDLMKSIATNPIREETKKAYLINVYNLAVIAKVIRAYPMNSPQDDGIFFTKKDIDLNGEKISLDHLENGILRPDYNDPRLHFVLVCGAIGCPQIEPFAYRAVNLEQQLDEQTTKALDKSEFIWLTEKKNQVSLSEIFKWYREDFGNNNLEVIEFIDQFRTEVVPTDYSVVYYPYDWSLNSVGEGSTSDDGNINLQTFTAGSLLGKGQMDFTLFNSIYTQTKSNWMDVDFSGTRETFVTNLFQFTLGVTKSKRINLGFDLNLRYNGNSTDDSFGKVGHAFAFKNNDSTRFGITAIGPRIKWQPFKKVHNFSIQSTALFPTIRHPEGFTDPTGVNSLSWADWNRITWWNQFFFDKTWPKVQIFAEVDLWFRFQRNSSQRSMLDLPWNLFLSWFPTKKLTLYVMTQHVNRFPIEFQANTDWVIAMNYTASGGGLKYVLFEGLNIELLYTNFWRAVNSGQGQSFNLGIKYIR